MEARKSFSTLTAQSDSKDNSADILHNLLGVDVGSIDKMLDSVDSAAQMLGMWDGCQDLEIPIKKGICDYWEMSLGMSGLINFGMDVRCINAGL